MAVDDVDGVVDVQRDGLRRPGVAGAVQVDQRVGQGDHLAQVRRVLPARHGRLRAEVAAAVGQAPAGQLEAGVGAKTIQVVGILIAAGDGQDAGPQDVGHAVRDEQRVARVRDQRREPIGDPEAALGGSQQHDAAVRGDAAAVEGGGDFLAADGWKAERLDRIVGHGGCGSA